MNNTLIIKNYLRPNSDGTFTIYLVPKVGKTKTRGFSTRITVSDNDLTKKRIIKNAEILAQIDDWKSNLRNFFAVLKQKHKALTAKMLQDEFLKGENETLVLSLYNSFIQESEKKIGKDLAIRTFLSYKTRKRNFRDYLEYDNNTSLTLSEITVETAQKYYDYLRYARKFRVNYCIRNVQFLARIIDYARRKKLIEYNILDAFEYPTKEKPNPVFLEPHELQLFENAKLQSLHLQRICDLFLFQCFTGFAYTDLASFDVKTHVFKDLDGTEWIVKKRDKSGNFAELPFFDEARQILCKYQDKLPLISNQKYNKYIKEVAEIIGVEKKITTHVARHTSAMIWLNEKGISLEVVAKMLGHINTEVTQSVYARIQRKRIKSETQKLINKKTA